MAEETKILSLEEKNAKVKEAVTHSVQAWHNGVIRNIEKAKKNPDNIGIAPEIFDRMIEVRNNNLPAFTEKCIDIAQHHKVTVDGKEKDTQYMVMGESTREAYKAFEDNVKKEIKVGGIAGLSGDKLDNQVDAAYKKVEKELPNGGILSTLGSAFFDEDKGGLRWGGILGALGGLFLGGMLGGGAEGGLLGIVVMVVGIAAGAWVGNFTSDAVNAKNEPEVAGGKTLEKNGQTQGQSRTNETQRSSTPSKQNTETGKREDPQEQPKQVKPDGQLEKKDEPVKPEEKSQRYYEGDNSLTAFVEDRKKQEKWEKAQQQVLGDYRPSPSVSETPSAPYTPSFLTDSTIEKSWSK